MIQNQIVTSGTLFIRVRAVSRLLRFTMHSLRDRYANTALHEWKYTEEVLLQQGSWKDPETVRRFYSGITDQTLAQAMVIHGSGAHV